MEVQIDIYELAQKLNDEDYNNLIVELFANANYDSHLELLKQMWDYVAEADKEEFIRYLNANRSENMSDELIQKTKERAEIYVDDTEHTFGSEALSEHFLNVQKYIKDAYFQGAWDMYNDKCNFCK